jgi:hypothetical protein
MIESHLFLLIVFAACVSVVFATLMRDDTREQLNLALRMFGGMIATALVLGWLMFPFPLG